MQSSCSPGNHVTQAIYDGTNYSEADCLDRTKFSLPEGLAEIPQQVITYPAGVEQNTVRQMHVVSFTVVNTHPKSTLFCHCIR